VSPAQLADGVADRLVDGHRGGARGPAGVMTIVVLDGDLQGEMAIAA
jgi:hypothetical protein